MFKKVKTLATMLLVALNLASSNAFAWGDASAGWQAVQNVQLVEQLNQQVQMVQQQISLVNQGVQNLTSMPQNLWRSFTGPLQQLMQTVGSAQGLAYNSINSAAQVKQMYGDPGGVITDYQRKLQSWVTNNQHQVAAALQANQINANASMTNAQQIQAISAASQTAVGQLQVMQAANQIAALQANQIQALQADMQAGNQVMMNFMMAQDQARVQDANVRARIYSAPTVFKGY